MSECIYRKHAVTHMCITFVRGSIGFLGEKNTDRLVFSSIRTVVYLSRTRGERINLAIVSHVFMLNYTNVLCSKTVHWSWVVDLSCITSVSPMTFSPPHYQREYQVINACWLGTQKGLRYSVVCY